MKRFFTAAAVTVALLPFFSMAENLPKIRITLAPEKVDIEQTGKVVELSSSGIKFVPGSAAEKLAVPGREFLWTPSEQTARTTGGADIYTTMLTSDGSAAVICERVGGMNEPNGLRIVVVETKTGKVIRATKVFEERVLYAALEDDTTLIAITTDPANAGTKFRIVKTDIAGETSENSEWYDALPDGAVFKNGLVYILSSAAKKVSVYNTDDFTLAGTCRIQNSGAMGLAISDDGNTLAVYGNDTVELYNGKVHNDTLYLKQKAVAAQESFSRCIMVDEKGEKMVLFSTGNPALLLIGSSFIRLNNIVCGEVAAADIKRNTLLLENRKRELELFELAAPVPDSKAKYAPLKMRPVVRNDNTALFFMPDKSGKKLLLADHRGNLWRLDLTGKRGKKHPLLIVDETGIRKR